MKREWIIFAGTEIVTNKDLSFDNNGRYKNIYNKNFSYMKLLTELNYTKSNNHISLIAIVLSIISIIISFIIAA